MDTILVLFYGSFILFFLSFLIPLIFTYRGTEKTRKISLILSFLGSVCLFILSAVVIYENKTFDFTIYSIIPQLSFSFLIDRLSAFFILLIALVSLSVAVYSIKYVEHTEKNTRKNLLVALMNMFIFFMVLVVSSKNMFSFLFFWEMMSVSSFLMVLFDYEKEESRRAGLFYFIMTQLSTVFLFIGFFLLYQNSGSFDITHVVGIEPTISAFIFICLFIGFSIKAGVIPFHMWLPYAHASSPSNISALMSGVMIKVAIYGLMRFVIFVLDPELLWGVIILVFGTISAILGVIYAMKEHDIKRLLAYHSIENIGIILIGFGLYIIFSSNGLDELATLSLLGALFHTLNHAVFKSLLFLTAGSVINATGTKNIEKMGGLIHRMPKTAFLFFIGAVSISALPPFNGFVSELMIFSAFMQSYALVDPILKILLIMCLSVFALTSALAAACFVKAFGMIFLGVPRSQKAGKAEEVDFPMIFGPSVLAFSCVFLGLFSSILFSLAGYPLQIPDMLFLGFILVIIYLMVFSVVYFNSSHKTRVCETWGCGGISQNSKMEYTASGFSDPVQVIFKSIYRTKKENKRVFFDKENSIFKEGYAEVHLLSFFEKYLYLPIAKFIGIISNFMYKRHNNDLDTYILYVFITVLMLLVLVRWLI